MYGYVIESIDVKTLGYEWIYPRNIQGYAILNFDEFWLLSLWQSGSGHRLLKATPRVAEKLQSNEFQPALQVTILTFESSIEAILHYIMSTVLLGAISWSCDLAQWLLCISVATTPILFFEGFEFWSYYSLHIYYIYIIYCVYIYITIYWRIHIYIYNIIQYNISFDMLNRGLWRIVWRIVVPRQPYDFALQFQLTSQSFPHWWAQELCSGLLDGQLRLVTVGPRAAAPAKPSRAARAIHGLYGPSWLRVEITDAVTRRFGFWTTRGG